MAFVLAVDAGTTGVRALALDETGAVKAWRYQEFAQHYPQPGWVEHDPTDIADAVRAVVAGETDVDTAIGALLARPLPFSE